MLRSHDTMIGRTWQTRQGAYLSGCWFESCNGMSKVRLVLTPQTDHLSRKAKLTVHIEESEWRWKVDSSLEHPGRLWSISVH